MTDPCKEIPCRHEKRHDRDLGILLLAVIAVAFIFGAMLMLAERKADSLQGQLDSLRAQQVAITARQQGIYAVQVYQCGMMVQYLEMGRVGQ